MIIIKNILLFVVISILVFSCNPRKRISGFYSYETECLGVEMDGSQTVKTWGRGITKTSALEQAKKNALKDIIFSGINIS